MSVTTIRPDSTIADGTSTIGGGAGSRHAALSDDSTATYVDVTGGSFFASMTLGFPDPGLPAGAVPTAGIIRVAGAVTSTGTATLGSALALGPQVATTTVDFRSTGFATLQTVFAGGDLSQRAASFWRVQGTSGVNLRLREVYLDIYYVTKPTVVANAPNGTLENTNRPTVLWTPSYDELSAGQFGYEVKIFTSAQYSAGGFNPSTSTAYAQTPTTTGSPFGDAYSFGFPLGKVTSWVVNKSLPNGDYRAYVRTIGRTNGILQYSDWDFESFSVNVSPPDAPAVALTSEPSNLRVKIDVTPDNSPITTDGFVLERSVDGGATWEYMNWFSGGSPKTAYDYRAPSGVPVSYRAAAWNDTDTSGRLYSAYTTEAISPDLPWRIVHPTDPSLSLNLEDHPDVYLRSVPGYSVAARQTVEQPLNRSDVVVHQDTTGPDTGQIVFMVDGVEPQERVRALLNSDASSLLLAGRASDAWRDRWVVFGDRDVTRVVDQSWSGLHDVTLNWTEVTRAPGQ